MQIRRIALFGFALSLAGAIVAQDQQEPAPQTLELTLKVGRRPNNVYNVPGFQPHRPLKLEGKAADAAAFRASMEQSLEYIFSEQQEDGSWRFHRRQLRAEARGNNFVGTANDSMNPVVLTSIACMALRSHQPLSPRRIEHAVSRGLEYVVANAPKHTKRRYGIWTWTFAIEFLVDEYRRTSDPALKARIREAADATAKRLLQDQHAGIVSARERHRAEPMEPEELLDDPRDRLERSSKGGFLGLTPSMDDEIGNVGALVQGVEARGPSATAGIRAGDRIVEIDGIKIESVDMLFTVADSLEPGRDVVVRVIRAPRAERAERPRSGGEEGDDGEGEAPRGRQNPDRQRRGQGGSVPPDGGWSYYVMGAMSFPTASAVLALMEARDIGCEIPKDAIDRGLALVESLRLDKKGSEHGFAYRAGATAGPSGDLRASIGRIAVCELTLFRAGRSDQTYLLNALRIFATLRGELDRVRGYPGNHFVRSYLNAAYYFLYGHYYSGRALLSLEDRRARAQIAAFIQEALLKIRHDDGTWTDHEAWGRVYGTSMAVLALGQLREIVGDAYASPIPSLEAKAPREYAENEY